MTAEQQLQDAFMAYDAFLWWLVCGSDSGPFTVRQVQQCAQRLADAQKPLRKAMRGVEYVTYRPPEDFPCSHDELRRYAPDGLQCKACFRVFSVNGFPA